MIDSTDAQRDLLFKVHATTGYLLFLVSQLPNHPFLHPTLRQDAHRLQQTLEDQEDGLFERARLNGRSITGEDIDQLAESYALAEHVLALNLLVQSWSHERRDAFLQELRALTTKYDIP